MRRQPYWQYVGLRARLRRTITNRGGQTIAKGETVLLGNYHRGFSIGPVDNPMIDGRRICIRGILLEDLELLDPINTEDPDRR